MKKDGITEELEYLSDETEDVISLEHPYSSFKRIITDDFLSNPNPISMLWLDFLILSLCCAKNSNKSLNTLKDEIEH